jgi:hypothetical protein
MLAGLLLGCGAPPPSKAVPVAAPSAPLAPKTLASPTTPSAAPPKTAAAPPPQPEAPIGYFTEAPGTESLFRVREALHTNGRASHHLALADGFVEVVDSATSLTAYFFPAGSSKSTPLFSLPAPLSYSDIQVDPSGQRIAVVVGREHNSTGDLYVWSKKTGVRRVIKSNQRRTLEKGFLRWTLDGKWLGLASMERPCGQQAECMRGLVLDPTTAAVKYFTPAQLGSGQLTFNAERGFICGSMDGEVGERRSDELVRVSRRDLTVDDKRDDCRWYELSLATGVTTRGGPPVFSSPDGKFQVRVEKHELAVTAGDGSQPYRISIMDLDVPIWFNEHTLELYGYAFDLASKTSRALAPADYRFMVLGHDRRSALLEKYTTGDDPGEVVVAELR